MPKPMRDLTGLRFGRLVVLRQTFDTWVHVPRRGDSRRVRNWVCLCDCGARKVVDASRLTVGNTRSCGCLLRETNSKKRVAVPTYNSYHQRLRRDKGHAKNYECVGCGGQAHEWSYDGLDPDDIPHERRPQIRYSIKDEHYRPMCQKCHRQFDQARLAAERDQSRVFYA